MAARLTVARIAGLLLLAISGADAIAADGMSVTQLVDAAAAYDAVVIALTPEQNTGFAVLDVPVKKSGDNVVSHWDAARHDLMVNGGYFNPDFTPTGLCRIDGKALGKLGSRTLSGFVAIDAGGKVSLLTLTNDVSAYPTVLQCGPYVIDPGGAIGIKGRAGPRARRTLMGRMTDGRLVIVSTSPVSLYDLAVSIKRNLPGIERLLNLDGGPSTGLKTQTMEIPNMWPVRNYIVKGRGTRPSENAPVSPAR